MTREAKPKLTREYVRSTVHRHNGLRGNVSMSIAHMRSICTAPTTTREAQNLAYEIWTSLERLGTMLETRIDPAQPGKDSTP